MPSSPDARSSAKRLEMRLELVVTALIRFLEMNGNLFSKPFRILLEQPAQGDRTADLRNL